MAKKIIKFILILLVFLVASAFAIPFLFKDKIVSRVKLAINKNVDAKVDFGDVDISLFRHFPRIAVALKNLSVTGLHEFSGDTLMSAGNIDVALNLLSVIRGPKMKIYSVTLENPRIQARVTKEGKANWNIAKEDTATANPAETKPFALELQQYAITNGYLTYDDEKSNVHSQIINVNHHGSGDFTSDVFTLSTSTKAEAVNFSYGNIPYLINTKTSVDADIQVDNRANRYQFKTGNIVVNNLALAAEGFFQLVTDSSYKMDIAFNMPSAEFRNILSLVPAIYKHDFEKIKSSGTAVLSGFVRGTYDSTHIPAYAFNLGVKNGSFQYTDLPRPVKNINLSVKVTNPDGVTDHAVVDIPQGHLEMDNEPFDFRVLLKNPVTDMFIDAAAKGKLNLSNITQFVKLESGTKLSGTVLADITVKGALSAMEQQRYNDFYTAGKIAVSSLQYASKEYPEGLKLNNLFMLFNPKDISISDLDGQYKKTNFSGNGVISNLLPYLLKGKTLGGNLTVSADHMNLNDWMGTSSDTVSKNTAASKPFAVPANLNFKVNATVARLIYNKLDIQHLTGTMTLKDESVVLNNISGEALDGSLLINGSYSTRDSKIKPAISLSYDVKDVDVQKTFNAFNTVQKLMPVGQYLSGKLSSQLKLTGNLGDNMMPEYRSLNGDGNLLLIEGLLKKFIPLEKLADLLNVGELKELTLKEVKNHIEFTNGMVLVKPFTVKAKGIEMEIGGMHGFDQSLDYLINLKIPRAMMGNSGNTFVNNLVTQVNQKGIPLQLGDIVNLHVKMGGTIRNPAFKVDLNEMAASAAEQLKQQAVSFAQSKIDNTRKDLKDSALSIKKQLEKNIQDELKKKIYGNNDSAKSNPADDSRKRLENAGRGILDNILKRNRKPDSAGK